MFIMIKAQSGPVVFDVFRNQLFWSVLAAKAIIYLSLDYTLSNI